MRRPFWAVGDEIGAVVREQRPELTFAPTARRKRIEILTEPPAHVAVVHVGLPLRCCRSI